MTTSRKDAKRFTLADGIALAREISATGWVVTILDEKLPAKTLVFSREADGRETDVTVSACLMCKNYFWVADSEIERPHFCPFCGIKFERTQLVSAAEMKEIQVL